MRVDISMKKMERVVREERQKVAERRWNREEG